MTDHNDVSFPHTNRASGTGWHFYIIGVINCWLLQRVNMCHTQRRADFTQFHKYYSPTLWLHPCPQTINPKLSEKCNFLHSRLYFIEIFMLRLPGRCLKYANTVFPLCYGLHTCIILFVHFLCFFIVIIWYNNNNNNNKHLNDIFYYSRCL